MVKGLKNANLMYFSSLHSWFRCSVCYYVQCSSSLNQRVNQRVKKHFFVKICFKSSIIKNRSQMYTSEKNTKQLTVGGGSTLTVSLTVKYPFFFDGFPKLSRRKFSNYHVIKTTLQPTIVFGNCSILKCV